MCDDIHIGNTQQTFKKIMEVHFSNLLCLLKNRQNQTHFLPTSASNLTLLRHCTDLRKYMTFKVVRQLNLIDAMKTPLVEGA